MANRHTGSFDVGTMRYTIERDDDGSLAASDRPAVLLLHGVDGMEGPSGTQLRALAGEIADAGYLVAIPQ